MQYEMNGFKTDKKSLNKNLLYAGLRLFKSTYKIVDDVDYSG